MKLTFKNLRNAATSIAVASALFFTTATFTSCGTDGCTDPLADNFNADATEDDGTCVYSGCTDSLANNFSATATTDDGSCSYDRDVFLGAWAGSDVCASDPTITYSSTITAVTTNKNQISISNFNGLNVSVVGTVSGSSLTIATQNFTIQGNDVSVVGSGLINNSGNSISLNFTVTFNGTPDSCTGTYTK